jgi:hypothetical protein
MAKRTNEIMSGRPRIAAEDVKKLYKIREQKLAERQPQEEDWKKIAAMSNPSMADWNDDPNNAAPPEYQDLFDNTMMKASNLLPDGIQGYSFNRSSAWMRMTTEDEDLMKWHTAKEWLQLAEVHLMKQAGKSLFYDEGRSLVKCCADFGTANLFRINDVMRGIPSYQTLHLKRTILIENPYGEVDTLFRDLWLSAFDAVAMFGTKGLPQQITDAYERGDTRLFPFQQFIFPTEKFDLDIERRQSKGMPFYSLYATQTGKEKALREGGYEIRPFFSWRWSRNIDGSVWGADSPGMIEISNAKQLNGMRKDAFRMRQLAARPPLKATEGLEGKIKLTPNGVTYLRQGQDFAQAMVVGNTQITVEDMEFIQKSINESYHANLFLILSQNIERIKTATEAAAIQGEQAAMITAFFGRMQAEFLEPAVEDLFQLELEAGRLPPPPRELQGRTLRVDLISPLAQLQKRYLLLDNTRQALNEILSIAKIQFEVTGEAPTVLDSIDFEQHARNIGELYHIDQRIIRDLIDVKRIQAARAKLKAQVMQQQMENEAMQAQAKAYGATAKAPEPGSPAESMVEGGRQA